MLKGPELSRAVEEWLRKEGLMRVRIVVFTLPTEYLAAKTSYRKNGEVLEEVKVFRVDPAAFRTLRRRFYGELHRIAWKSEVGWVVRTGADLSPIAESVRELNALLKKHGITSERFIDVIEAYLPKAFVVKELHRYIRERRLALGKLREKLERLEEEKTAKRRAIERLAQEIASLEEEIRALEEEMLRIAQT